MNNPRMTGDGFQFGITYTCLWGSVCSECVEDYNTLARVTSVNEQHA
jgi:hypothetical protein